MLEVYWKQLDGRRYPSILDAASHFLDLLYTLLIFTVRHGPGLGVYTMMMLINPLQQANLV